MARLDSVPRKLRLFLSLRHMGRIACSTHVALALTLIAG